MTTALCLEISLRPGLGVCAEGFLAPTAETESSKAIQLISETLTQNSPPLAHRLCTHQSIADPFFKKLTPWNPGFSIETLSRLKLRLGGVSGLGFTDF
jgi:hypothetical protein